MYETRKVIDLNIFLSWIFNIKINLYLYDRLEIPKRRQIYNIFKSYSLYIIKSGK